MKPRPVTHLFLDAGNTIVHVNMRVVGQALARRGVRLTPDELWRGEHRIRPAVDDPCLIARSSDATRWRLYFASILRACGVERPGVVEPVLDELRAYHRRHNLWEVAPPGVRVALDLLRRRFRLGVISNSDGSVRRKLWRTGLAGFFDVIVDSHEEGVEKPDPRLFRIAMARAGARPERALHVGDFYHIDVAGARAAGMGAVLLDPAGVHADKPVRRIAHLDDLLGQEFPSGESRMANGG
jgi:putative hydrolase of the HAD superfamily